MFTFEPRIVHGDYSYALPRPILTLRLGDAWDVQRFKVPLREGSILTGHSRNGTEIRIEGQIGSQAGTLRLTEQAMFETLEELRTAVDVSHQSGPFMLSLYGDAQGLHRYFAACTTLRLELDLSDKHLFSYSLHIHAAEPVIRHGLLY